MVGLAAGYDKLGDVAVGEEGVGNRRLMVEAVKRGEPAAERRLIQWNLLMTCSEEFRTLFCLR